MPMMADVDDLEDNVQGSPFSRDQNCRHSSRSRESPGSRQAGQLNIIVIHHHGDHHNQHRHHCHHHHHSDHHNHHCIPAANEDQVDQKPSQSLSLLSSLSSSFTSYLQEVLRCCSGTTKVFTEKSRFAITFSTMVAIICLRHLLHHLLQHNSYCIHLLPLIYSKFL